MLPSPVETVLEECFGQKRNLYFGSALYVVCFPLKLSVWLLKSGGFLSTSRDLDVPATLASFSPVGLSSSKSDSFTKSLILQISFHLKLRNSQ